MTKDEAHVVRKDEALRMALEALKSSNKLINGTGTKFGLEGAMDGYYSGCFDVEGNNKLLNKAITAIKEALAQPEQEPVAWYIREKDSATTDGCWAEKNLDICEPLYTTPPQRTWAGLTEQEAAECWSTSTVRTWQAIEAKLKEKNT